MPFFQKYLQNFNESALCRFTRRFVGSGRRHPHNFSEVGDDDVTTEATAIGYLTLDVAIRVARFFLVHATKPGKNVTNEYKMYKWS
jgi:hypothetical protein